jgi:glycosyltransferase involved in cell wall biosynthesis
MAGLPDMNILISSHVFEPGVGGLERVSRALAEGFVKAGHAVCVITQTPAGDIKDNFSFELIRRPSVSRLFKLLRWCDVYFQNNISLRTAWPLLFVKKPWVVAHHIWLTRPDGWVGVRDRLKRFLIRFAKNISVSRAIAADLPAPSVVIGDPYEDKLFVTLPGVEKSFPLIFVGRLVSDKGVDVLFQALKNLKTRNRTPSLTVVGEGPEEPFLRKLAVSLEIADQVHFVGVKQGSELVEFLNRHEILVVPSRWNEPFGVVALEGIACGCVVVGSQGGGLKEAVGPCGVTFPNGDAGMLADTLEKLLAEPGLLKACREDAKIHLEKYTKERIAREYLEVLCDLA